MIEAIPASGEPAPIDEARAQRVPNAMPFAVPSSQKLRAHEHQKTSEERAEDVAYTINHAISCATTDVLIAPTISSLYSSRQLPNLPHFLHEAGHYLGGEIIGDFTAVPLTIFVQRQFPSFMALVGRIIDPVAKPIFHHGAQKAAERWGEKHGFADTDAEVVNRAEEIYQHEIAHLPQAVVWNMFSFPLGVIGQKWLGHNETISGIVKGKLLGTAISNVLLIGGRALLPDKAEKFDRLDGKYVIRPVTRAFSGLLGIDRNTVDRMDEKAEKDEQRANGSWRARVRHQDEANTNLAAQQGV